MLKPEIEKAFNYQINRELYSAYLYLAMANYFSEKGLSGFANWMNVQVQEEVAHANGMLKYVLDRGGHIELDTIEKPEVTWNSVLEVFEHTLEHEQLVTSLINKLADTIDEHKDRAAASFVLWYIDEQVEEEANVNDIISKLKLAGEDCNSLLLLDNEMATRTFVAPVIK